MPHGSRRRWRRRIGADAQQAPCFAVQWAGLRRGATPAAALEEGNLDELLQTCDGAGHPAGLVPRARVHALGLWHRAVHVWVFAADGRVWVQRRGPDKDINPHRWDVSVGEHLQPGESSEDGAHRGLGEELGISVDDLVALGEPRPMAQDYPELALHDYELQQAYRCVHTGPVAAAADEVSALRLIEPAALRAWSEAEPDAFTPGFHRDRIELGVF